MFFYDFLKQRAGLFGVIVVADSKDHVHPSCVTGGGIGDGLTPDGFVGDKNDLVVKRGDCRGDEANAVDFSRHSSDFDSITHVKGTVNQEHEAGGKITEGVLQGKADYKRAASDESHKGSQIDSKRRECHQKSDEQDNATHQFVDEPFE